MATPLLAALVVVEVTDVIFAVDSVPAILAVSREPFIVFSSNAFAILGLRALYFLLGGASEKFHYLSHALGAILVFVGIKMMVSHWWHMPTLASLAVIIADPRAPPSCSASARRAARRSGSTPHEARASRALRRSRGGTLIPVVAGTLGPAAAAVVTTCGEVVTEDATLAADLHCPSGNGIVVGANGVVVDLMGHTLSGTPTGNGVSATDRGGVVVRNGTVSGFAVGVELQGGAGARTEALRVEIAAGDETRASSSAAPTTAPCWTTCWSAAASACRSSSPPTETA